jgi:predicted transcriptional regulator
MVKVTEIKSRMGAFCVVEVSGYKLVTPCDTRVKIIKSLAQREMTADDIAKEVGASYSTVMDHMDLLEKVGIVESFLKRVEGESGRRKICFKLAQAESK